MVHTDLCTKNIRVRVDGQRRIEGEPVLNFIDFDWAGLEWWVRYAILHSSTLILPGQRGPQLMRQLVEVMIDLSSIITGTRLFSQRNPPSFND